MYSNGLHLPVFARIFFFVSLPNRRSEGLRHTSRNAWQDVCRSSKNVCVRSYFLVWCPWIKSVFEVLTKWKKPVYLWNAGEQLALVETPYQPSSVQSWSSRENSSLVDSSLQFQVSPPSTHTLVSLRLHSLSHFSPHFLPHLLSFPSLPAGILQYHLFRL